MVKREKTVVKAKKTRKVREGVGLFLTGAVLALVFILGLIWWVVEGSKSDLEKRGFEDRGVPVMEISLNGVALSEIDEGSKETKYEENEVTVYEDGETTELDNVMIKGRGNGSWVREKKSYRISLDEKNNLLGLGRARKWNLLANAADDSSLRNEAAFDLQKLLDMKYPFDGRFVELYIDGDYRGLYYLARVVEIDKDLVDLRDDLGVLVELDNYYGRTEDYYMAKNGDLLVAKDSVSKDKRQLAMKEFLRAYNELEDAIVDKDFKRVEDVIDVESFAKYFLLSEFSVNPDAYWTSFFMYKDGVDDKIHAGPGWDFDLAFGNRNWGNWLGEKFYSPRETTIRKQELLPKEFYDENNIENGYEASLLLSRVMFNLIDLPEFNDEIERIFRERMAGREKEFIKEIDGSAEEIYVAAKTDELKWEKKDYEQELNELIRWIKERYEYFEEVYGDNEYNLLEMV